MINHKRSLVRNLFRDKCFITVKHWVRISGRTVEQNIPKLFQVTFRGLWDCHVCPLARTHPAICSCHSRWQNSIPCSGFSLLNIDPCTLRHGANDFLIINHWCWTRKRQQTPTWLLIYIKPRPSNGLHILVTNKCPKTSDANVLKDRLLIHYCLPFEKPGVQI